MDLKTTKTKFMSTFDAGLNAHQAGDLSQAEKLYQRTLVEQPDHCEANHNLGVVFASRKDFSQALQFFKFALETSPNVSLFWASYIEVLVKLERITEARVLVTKLREAEIFCDKMEGLSTHLNAKYPDPSAGELDELERLVEQDKYDDAIMACNNFIINYPDSAALNAILGRCYSEQGHTLLAISKFERATAIRPEWTPGFIMLGRLYSLSDNSDKVISNLKKAVELEPKTHETNLILATELFKIDDFAASIIYFEQALVQKPDCDNTLLMLAQANAKEGKFNEAIACCKKAIAISPDDASLYYNLAMAQHGAGLFEEALDSYKHSIKINPKNVHAHNSLGGLFCDLGKTNQALKSFKTALDLEPSNPVVLENVAVGFYKLGETEKAVDSLTQALEKNPKNLRIKHLLASLKGEQTEAAPDAYVEWVFDGFASNFEDHLIGNLQYKTPKLMTEIIKQHQTSEQLRSVLDLGCGTGLTGVELQNMCQSIVGIDLSKKMLEVAKQKKLYDELIHASIEDYLANAPLNFDLFVATDVFVYVGDLSEIFRLIKLRNKTKGRLVFSTEHNETAEVFLEKSGRFSHSKKYIESLCKKFECEILHYSTHNLRKEKDEFITGGLFLISF